MRNNEGRDRHAMGDREAPWLMPPKQRRMPKIVRKILFALGLIALLILIGYIILLLNPSLMRHVEYS